MINSVCFLFLEPLKLYYLRLLVWLTTVECPWHFLHQPVSKWNFLWTLKKNIGKMSIIETHGKRADQTLKANTRKQKEASAGGWRQVPKSDPHYQELVYSTNLTTPPPAPTPTPHWIVQVTRSKSFLYSRCHSAVPPSLQRQTTQILTNKWSEVNKHKAPTNKRWTSRLFIIVAKAFSELRIIEKQILTATFDWVSRLVNKNSVSPDCDLRRADHVASLPFLLSHPVFAKYGRSSRKRPPRKFTEKVVVSRAVGEQK